MRYDTIVCKQSDVFYGISLILKKVLLIACANSNEIVSIFVDTLR